MIFEKSMDYIAATVVSFHFLIRNTILIANMITIDKTMLTQYNSSKCVLKWSVISTHYDRCQIELL